MQKQAGQRFAQVQEELVLSLVPLPVLQPESANTLVSEPSSVISDATLRSHQISAAPKQ